MVNGNGKVGLTKDLSFHKDPLKLRKKKQNGKGRRKDFFDIDNPAFDLIIMSRYVPISLY